MPMWMPTRNPQLVARQGRPASGLPVSSLGFPGSKASAQTPIAGTVVQGAFDYADLKVKPGQTIRILAKESCGYKADDDGLFPEILLTLK